MIIKAIPEKLTFSKGKDCDIIKDRYSALVKKALTKTIRQTLWGRG
jgi:hypothetical protein